VIGPRNLPINDPVICLHCGQQAFEVDFRISVIEVVFVYGGNGDVCKLRPKTIKEKLEMPFLGCVKCGWPEFTVVRKRFEA
jgi:hypothetical protein